MRMNLSKSVVGVSIVSAVLAVGFATRLLGVVPYWVPVVGEDSGVAACAAIAASGSTRVDGGAGEGATDAEKVRDVRAMFDNSRDEGIRENGVELMDLSAQVQGIVGGENAGESFGTLVALMGPISSAYAGLAGACAEHGYIIPPMEGK